MKKHARKSNAEKYEKTMKNDAKKGAKSQQKPSKNKVWKMVGFWIDFSEFSRFLGGPIFTLIYLR